MLSPSTPVYSAWATILGCVFECADDLCGFLSRQIPATKTRLFFICHIRSDMNLNSLKFCHYTSEFEGYFAETHQFVSTAAKFPYQFLLCCLSYSLK